MRQVSRLASAVVLVGVAAVSRPDRVVAQKPQKTMTTTTTTTTTVARLYTGADGRSHAENSDIPWRQAKLHPELSESESINVTGAQFLRWPRGFVWQGHPASKRQYVIIVSGRGEVDVAGGQTVQLAPGRVLLAEDVTGEGHTTRIGPDEDLVMLLVVPLRSGFLGVLHVPRSDLWCSGGWRGVRRPDLAGAEVSSDADRRPRHGQRARAHQRRVSRPAVSAIFSPASGRRPHAATPLCSRARHRDGPLVPRLPWPDRLASVRRCSSRSSRRAPAAA